MNVYKKLNLNDVGAYPFKVNKLLDNKDLVGYVQEFAYESNDNEFKGIISNFYKNLDENGNLYEPIINGSSSLNLKIGENRIPPTTSVKVISISSSIYGDAINPGSLKMTLEFPDSSPDEFENAYIYDDGNGNVLLESLDGEGNIIINHFGNIIYGAGLVFLLPILELKDASDISVRTLNIHSEYTIWETQFKCTISNNEYNSSNNPTYKTLSGDSRGEYFFTPYITTIGLYNDEFELLAVAKLSKPHKCPTNTDLNFMIRIDR